MRLRSVLYCIILLGYLIGAHGGYLALWYGDDPSPVRIFPCRISSLPPADQALLKKGIRLDTEAQVHQYLEDYLS